MHKSHIPCLIRSKKILFQIQIVNSFRAILFRLSSGIVNIIIIYNLCFNKLGWYRFEIWIYLSVKVANCNFSYSSMIKAIRWYEYSAYSSGSLPRWIFKIYVGVYVLLSSHTATYWFTYVDGCGEARSYINSVQYKTKNRLARSVPHWCEQVGYTRRYKEQVLRIFVNMRLLLDSNLAL